MKRLILTAATAASFALMLPITGNAADQELKTEEVSIQNIAKMQQFDGVVEAVNRSTISAQTSGRIIDVLFDVDDFVKAGEIIVRFSDSEHKARLAQAQSSLSAAMAASSGAQKEFKRVEKLLARGTVAKARFDSSEVQLNVALARVETAKAAVEQANEQLGYTVIKAPYSGLVVQRHVQIGEVANPGQPLMTGFSMEKLRINVAVPQQIANHVRRENSAVIYDGVGGSITTKNLTVFPFADAKSNTVTIRAALPEGIKTVFPGMLVKVAFKTGVQKTMVLPSSAVVKRGEVTGVYIVDKNAKMYLQQIRTGRIMGENIEITSGLAAGNIVASDPLKATLVLKSKIKETK